MSVEHNGAMICQRSHVRETGKIIVKSTTNNLSANDRVRQSYWEDQQLRPGYAASS